MDIENIPDVLNGSVDVNGINKAMGDIAPSEWKTPDNPTESSTERIKRRAKRAAQRQNSREGITNGVSGVGPVLVGANGLTNYFAPQRRWKNSRRSRNSHGRGLPKKGGAGGKGVWGKIGSELLVEEDAEDQNDPNYDNEKNDKNIELFEVIPEPSPEEFFKLVEPIMLEYFENGDTHEVAISLDEILVGSSLRQCVTSVAVEIAMDHKDSHREMTSLLISDLYGRVITPKDIIKGNKTYIYTYMLVKSYFVIKSFFFYYQALICF